MFHFWGEGVLCSEDSRRWLFRFVALLFEVGELHWILGIGFVGGNVCSGSGWGMWGKWSFGIHFDSSTLCVALWRKKGVFEWFFHEVSCLLQRHSSLWYFFLVIRCCRCEYGIFLWFIIFVMLGMGIDLLMLTCIVFADGQII